MRIIGGRLRGRKLRNFSADHIRPTTDRVKETIFNILRDGLDGARVLDLFSGTGNLTCEALSRGARLVECVELSRKSVAIMKANFAELNLQKEVQIHQLDVFKFLQRYRGEPFDLIFCDPPFTQKLAHEVMSSLASSPVVGEHTTIVIEYSRHERLDKTYDFLFRQDERKFGDKSAAFFWPALTEDG